jgi:SAM-dependent methyltransferase
MTYCNRDSLERYRHDQALIRRKPFLRRLYGDFYSEIVSALPRDVEGAVAEIGSGAGFLKDFLPQLITSEVLPSGMNDLCFDACRIPFRSASLKGILMLDVFHHIPSPAAFLEEATRCLKPGGAVIMIEPWMTPWSLGVLRLLHHERTDPRQIGWDFANTGPMSGANQALPWIVFQRDRNLFEERFPELDIINVSLHTPFCYLVSGGLTRWQAASGSWYPTVRRLENLLKPHYSVLAMFATIVIQLRR